MTPERLREILDALYGTPGRPVGWNARYRDPYTPGTLVLTDDEAAELQARKLATLAVSGKAYGTAQGREAWKALP